MPLVHDSWMRLKPNEIEGGKESFEDYYSRIHEKKDFSHIPKEVFIQWIYEHHDNDYMAKNYGWLDYEKVRFDLVQWETAAFRNLYVIESFRDCVTGRAEFKDISQFNCTEEDLSSWKQKGTWKTPPIILDITTLKMKIPNWSELQPPFQLVEGHSRYGYLRSMMVQAKGNKSIIAPQHSIYLMRAE